jgi:D-glycero-D-manno-heptose 1,7-bisphosphate phosphatase
LVLRSGTDHVRDANPIGGPSASGVRSAVFVDRDGTLNPDLHYLADAARLELFRDVPSGIRLLNLGGYAVVCVTNQSGVERGFYSQEDVERIHHRMNEMLARKGAVIDAFYYCPHAPERGCHCRKPGTELFLQAARELHLELSTSAVIGDRAYDVLAGERLGLLTAAVRNDGHGGALDAELRAEHVDADIHASSFLGAARRILTRS